MLTLEGVGKTYRSGGGLLRAGAAVEALRDVSFTVERGECFGLVGQSGSGKSTLTRCILRLEEPSAGRILFDGQDLASLSRRRLASDAQPHPDRVPGPLRLAQSPDVGP